MIILKKILNYKNTVKYHKFIRDFQFSFFKIKLYFVHFFALKNICIIILPEHIGDIIAFTPFAENLRKESKNNFIIWITNHNYIALLKNNPNIDMILGAPCDGFIQKVLNLKKYNIFDVRFNGNNYCVYCPTHKVFNKIDHNFTLQNYYEYGSLLEIFSKIAQKPLFKENWKPQIIIDKLSINKIESLNLPQKFIAIHTVSNDPEREWKNEKWEKLFYILKNTYNLPVIEIGLKSNLQIVDEMYINTCGKLNLTETTTLISRAFLYIGVDSGPAHMANAVETKSVILLGKYRDIEQYMPFSGNFAQGINSKIIYNKNVKCGDIEITEVLNAIKNII